MPSSATAAGPWRREASPYAPAATGTATAQYSQGIPNQEHGLNPERRASGNTVAESGISAVNRPQQASVRFGVPVSATARASTAQTAGSSGSK